MPARARTAALLATLALLAAACGSTVRTDPAAIAAAPPAAATGDGMALPAAGGPAGSVGGPLGPGRVGPAGTAPGTAGAAAPAAAPGGTAAGAAPGGTTAAGAASAVPPASGAAGGPAAAPAGPAAAAPAGPATGTPIKVGIPYLDGAAAALTAGTGTEVSFGDGQLQAQALVDDLNARGGILGRPIEPVFAGVEAVSTDQQSAFAAACSRFVEDEQVFAVLNTINPPESFVACVAGRGTPMLNASFSAGDEHLYELYPDTFFSPAMLSLDAQARLMVESLAADGTLAAPTTKVGVFVYTGDPQMRRVVDRALLPALEAAGAPVEVAEAGLGQESAAQLRFAALGVTHVIFSSPSGIQQLFFMNAAENQGYRPTYVMSDADSTRFVSESAPPGQVRGIRGVGTLPLSNVPLQSYPTTPLEQRCLDVIRAGGEDNQSRMTNLTATVMCEIVWSFEAIATAAGSDLTAEAFRTGYRRVGAGYTPVVTFAADLSTASNDNAALYRPFGWDDGCGCLAYTGEARPVPR